MVFRGDVARGTPFGRVGDRPASYRQQTAIYTINDVDIVALCNLWNPPAPGTGGRLWSRGEMFDTVAAPLLSDGRYQSKVRYGLGSMCIKVGLGIRVEILPVMYKAGNCDPQAEPFRLYRPEAAGFHDGFARYHRQHLTNKNVATGGNFVPTIKVLKHLRSQFSLDAVSFHIECLLHSLPDSVFLGTPADYLAAVLGHIAGASADTWHGKVCSTPCGDRDVFTANEWTRQSWSTFHESIVLWAKAASVANHISDKGSAIEAWQLILGSDFFSTSVS